MEGPLLVLKSWALTALAIWVYRRWLQRVTPPTPEFEAFCATQPVVAALFGVAEAVRLGSLGLREPDALLLSLRNRVNDAVPGVAR